MAEINHRGGRNVRRAAGILDPKTIRKLAERGSKNEEDIDVFDQVHLPKRKYYQWAILKPENKSDLAKLVAIKQVDINMPYNEASITLARELIKLEHQMSPNFTELSKTRFLARHCAFGIITTKEKFFITTKCARWKL